MSEQYECICLECGISVYLMPEFICLDDLPNSDLKLVRNIFCTECGGPLALTGKAGKEPHYRIE